MPSRRVDAAAFLVFLAAAARTGIVSSRHRHLRLLYSIIGASGVSYNQPRSGK
jgi:hypothetical protein